MLSYIHIALGPPGAMDIDRAIVAAIVARDQKVHPSGPPKIILTLSLSFSLGNAPSV